ncbi:MAG: protein-disulfide reductase DsbD domain-containing protein [Saprospiraceae bacterium]
MKHLLLSVCVILGFSFTQKTTTLEPVKWKFSTEKINGSTYLVMKANIQEGWKMYGSFPTLSTNYEECNGDLGPACLEVEVEEGKSLLIGDVKSTKSPKKSYDKVFQGEITYYTNKIELRQKIKNVPNQKIAGYVYFMSCNDEKCMPPKYAEFDLTIAK